MTVGHLLGVVSGMDFHEADVVLYANRATRRRPHAPAARRKLPAGLIELLVRRFKANASLCGRRGSTGWIHRSVGLRLRKRGLRQHPPEKEATDDWVKDRRELQELRWTAIRLLADS